MTKWWCGDCQFIFEKYWKAVSWSKALKLQAKSHKYVVVEFVTTRQANPLHFPNAVQISVLDPKKVLRLISNQQIILLNNTEMMARQYYRFLTHHHYKVYWIKPRKEAKTRESF